MLASTASFDPSAGRRGRRHPWLSLSAPLLSAVSALKLFFVFFVIFVATETA
jgi:hypothetical protein